MASIKSVDLTGFVDRVMKESGRRRKDDNLTYHCPFCHHRKRKLEVQVHAPFPWHCWTCDAKGLGLFSLLKKLKAPRKDFEDLEKIVGVEKKSLPNKDYVIELDLSSDDEKKSEKVEAVEFPGEFHSLLHDDGSFSYRNAIRYAKKRKISISDIVTYNVGYCSKGLFADRLVFPSYDKDNRLNFFSCRSYYDDNPMKYRNSEVSKDIIGFENLVDFDHPISLCEGALDAIGIKRNAIPLFGKTMSKKLRTAIVTGKCQEVNIVLDNDALRSAVAIAEDLMQYGKRVRLVRLQGKDPNVLGFQKTTEAIRNTDFLDFASLMMIKLGLGK